MNEEAFRILVALGDIDADLVEEARPKGYPGCSDGGGGGLRSAAPKVIAIALAAALPASAVAGDNISSMREALQEKTATTYMTPEEVESLAQKLDKMGISGAEIKNDPPLRANEFGQTYGIDTYEPDLVAVVATNGKEGYVYRGELEQADDILLSITDPEESGRALDHQKPVMINVYLKDGRTIIGKFKAYWIVGWKPAQTNQESK